MARTKTRPALGRFRRPIWRDGAFWAAVALTAVVFAIQVLLASERTGALAWLGFAVRLVITWLIMSSLMRIRVGMERGLVAGFAEAERRAAERASTGSLSTPEAAARARGRLAGRVLRAYRRGTGPGRR